MKTAIAFFYASKRQRIPRRPLGLWLYRQLYSLYRSTLNRSGERSRLCDYRPGLDAALASLRRHHASVPPVLLLTPDRISPRAAVDRVIAIDPRPYERIPKIYFEFGMGMYMKLELFKLQDFERVVYFDADTIITSDVSELWDEGRYNDKALYAVRESELYGAAPSMVGHYNAGVMIINPPMLDGAAYRHALDLALAGASTDGGDQGIVNQVVNGSNPAWCAGAPDPMFNVMVNQLTIESGILERISPRILHFTGNFKPWLVPRPEDASNTAMRQLWLDAQGN